MITFQAHRAGWRVPDAGLLARQHEAFVPGAAVCTGAAIVVHTVAVFFLRNWFGQYGHAYGGFGVGLALIAFVGIIASFWVWIATAMGVYWERKAGSAAVAAMEELSADISAS